VLVPIPNSYFLMPDALGPASLLVRGRPGTVSPTKGHSQKGSGRSCPTLLLKTAETGF